MREGGSGYLADLTTAPIFDDAVYLSEALNLPESRNEDDLDTQLVLSARESGIDDPYRFLCPDVHDVSTAMSTLTVSSEPRSSMSIHSRETQSTGVTSHPSRTSKDSPNMEGTPALRTPPLTRASLSSEDYYDAMVGRSRPGARHRTSSSAVSGENSIFSNSASLLQPTPRKQKRASGLSLFSMFRRDSSTCPSRSHRGHHAKPLTPKLGCGHTLSKYAIRVHIQEALENREHVAPNCCGRPLPRSVLETVLTKEEADLVAPDGLPSPTHGSPRDSGYSEDEMSSIDIPHTLDARSHSAGSFVAASDAPSRAAAREDEESLNQALAGEAFRTLKAQQKELFQRVSVFESNQRKALSAYHQWSLKRLTSQLETSKSERAKQHAIELERLDESQLVAEHDLRRAHAQETQNVATALKYMEAYCSGSNPTNPEIAHTVTEEDRKKLARQHLTQQRLPAKHESAINVLRARQEKDVKIKLRKQQTELQQLDADYEREKRAEELQFLKDSSRLDALMEARRRKEIHRWDLKVEIWRRDWENQHGTVLIGRLPHEDWPEAPEDAPLDSPSSLVLYLQAIA